MLVTFLKDTEVNGRKFLAGETREFDEVIANALIEAGSAASPDTHEATTEPVRKAKKK